MSKNVPFQESQLRKGNEKKILDDEKRDVLKAWHKLLDMKTKPQTSEPRQPPLRLSAEIASFPESVHGGASLVPELNIDSKKKPKRIVLKVFSGS